MIIEEDKYTSFELSKKLKENGCDFGFNIGWTKDSEEIMKVKNSNKDLIYPAYDFLWDICCYYSHKFFGRKKALICPPIILNMIFNGDFDEAEKYIWENCLFNKKNKK